MTTSLIYHYTTFAGFKGIIEGRALWASDIRYLNDFSEVIQGKELLRQLTEMLPELIPSHAKLDEIAANIEQLVDLETTCFATCFCQHPDLLSQWRGYTEGNTGLAIGFDAQLLKTTVDLPILRVIYDEASVIQAMERAIRVFAQKVSISLESGARIDDLMQELFLIIVTSKNPSFREEAEFRLIADVEKTKIWPVRYRTKGSLMVPYLSIDIAASWPRLIQEIWVGPSSYGDASWKSVREFIDYHGLDLVTLHKSASPYRT